MMSEGGIRVCLETDAEIALRRSLVRSRSAPPNKQQFESRRKAAFVLFRARIAPWATAEPLLVAFDRQDQAGGCRCRAQLHLSFVDFALAVVIHFPSAPA